MWGGPVLVFHVWWVACYLWVLIQRIDRLRRRHCILETGNCNHTYSKFSAYHKTGNFHHSHLYNRFLRHKAKSSEYKGCVTDI